MLDRLQSLLPTLGTVAFWGVTGWTAWRICRAIRRRPRVVTSPMLEAQRDDFDAFVEWVGELDEWDVEFLEDVTKRYAHQGIGFYAAEARAWRALERSNRLWSLDEDLEMVTDVLHCAQSVAVARAVGDLLHPADRHLLMSWWPAIYADWLSWSSPDRPAPRLKPKARALLQTFLAQNPGL